MGVMLNQEIAEKTAVLNKKESALAAPWSKPHAKTKPIQEMNSRPVFLFAPFGDVFWLKASTLLGAAFLICMTIYIFVYVYNILIYIYIYIEMNDVA